MGIILQGSKQARKEVEFRAKFLTNHIGNYTPNQEPFSERFSLPISHSTWLTLLIQLIQAEMWRYYIFGATWELWAVPCHKQPPINLQHEGFIDDVTCRASTGFLGHCGLIWSLYLPENSPLEVSHNLFWISVLLPVSVSPNWISWPIAHLWYVQENSSQTGRPVFAQQNCHSGSMLCKAALHVKGCAWGANFLLNTFKSPWRFLTHFHFFQPVSTYSFFCSVLLPQHKITCLGLICGWKFTTMA